MGKSLRRVARPGTIAKVYACGTMGPGDEHRGDTFGCGNARTDEGCGTVHSFEGPEPGSASNTATAQLFVVLRGARVKEKHLPRAEPVTELPYPASAARMAARAESALVPSGPPA